MPSPTTLVALRVPNDIFARMRARLEKRNAQPTRPEWSQTDYILYCIVSDLKHSARSKKAQQKKRKTPPSPEVPPAVEELGTAV